MKLEIQRGNANVIFQKEDDGDVIVCYIYEGRTVCEFMIKRNSCDAVAALLTAKK